MIPSLGDCSLQSIQTVGNHKKLALWEQTFHQLESNTFFLLIINLCYLAYFN